MEIKIASIQKGTPAQEFLPLITDAHNLRYSHAEKNCLYFQIFRFPYKEMTKAVASYEDGTVIDSCKNAEGLLCSLTRSTYITERKQRLLTKSTKKTAGKLPPFSFSVISVNPAAPDLLTARKTEKRAGAVALARRPAVR